MIRLGHQNIHLIAIERAGQPHHGLHCTLCRSVSGDKELQIVEQIGTHGLDIEQHVGQVVELCLHLVERLCHGKLSCLAIEHAHRVSLLLLQPWNRAQRLLQLFLKFCNGVSYCVLLFLSPCVEFCGWLLVRTD